MIVWKKFLGLLLSTTLSVILVKASKVTCPTGEFLCGNHSSECLEQIYWCDGTNDCPKGFDEQLNTCERFDEEIERLMSPSLDNATYSMFKPNSCELTVFHYNCTCLWHTGLRCRNLGFTSIPQIDEKVTVLSLSSNRISRIYVQSFEKLEKLLELHLDGNLIESLPVGVFYGLSNLYKMRLDLNPITALEEHYFVHTKSLNYLYVNGCGLRFIEQKTFWYIPNLLLLDLSNNKLTALNKELFNKNFLLEQLLLGGNPLKLIHVETFWSLTNLELINLRDCPFENSSLYHFQPLTNLHQAKFATFGHCQYVPFVKKCLPKGDGLSTIGNLLGDMVLRGCVWIVAVFSLLGNISVLVGRSYLREGNEAHVITIENLCVADLLMGVYLVIIASQDIRYRENYYAHAYEWTSGWQCQLTGMLAMLSTEASILILTCLSLERYLIITKPFRFVKIERKYAYLTLVIVWICSLLLSVLPVVTSQPKHTFYGSNGVCFPLHIQNPYTAGWQWSAFIFVGLNTVAISTMVICNCLMYISVRRSRIWGQSAKANDAIVARRFCWIIIAGILCSIPIVIFKSIAYTGVKIPETAHAWLSVLVIPVNSALDPLLYSLTTLQFRRFLSKWCGHLPLPDTSTMTRLKLLGNKDDVFRRRKSRASVSSDSSGLGFRRLLDSFRSKRFSSASSCSKQDTTMCNITSGADIL